MDRAIALSLIRQTGEAGDIKPVTPGLQGEPFIHYSMAAMMAASDHTLRICAPQAQTRQHECAVSSEPSLLVYAINAKISFWISFIII